MISCGEAYGLALLKFGSGIMAIADLVILIWVSKLQHDGSADFEN